MKFTINGSEWEIREISNEEMITLMADTEGFTHGNTEYSLNVINLNKSTPNKKKTLYHELMHCYMYEYGHNQWEKEFNNEDVCEISATAHDFIHQIVEDYLKNNK